MNTLTLLPAGPLPDTTDAAGESRAHILDAALALFLDFGVKRTTMDDVARRAGVGRATVYRCHPDKNSLVQAVILRECLRSNHEIEKKLKRIRDPEKRFVEGFVTVVQTARQHALVQRLFDTESEWLLPYLTVHGSATLDWGRAHVGTHLRALQEEGLLAGVQVDAAAELLLRLLQSLVLTPGSLVSAQDETGLRRYARDFLLPLLNGGH